MNLTNLLVVSLVVWRLTRLVTRDYITARPRRWLQRRVGPNFAYLLGCPVCSSMWVALFVGVPWFVWHGADLAEVVFGVIAAAGASALLAINADPFDPVEMIEPVDVDGVD